MKLKERVVETDGLLLVTPEYNTSIPGVLKNAIDWLTRPAKDIPRVFGDKPVALMGATPGPGGTRLAQAAWLPVLRILRTRYYLKDDKGEFLDKAPSDLFLRVANAVAAAERTPAERQRWAKAFLEAIKGMIMMLEEACEAAGRSLKDLSLVVPHQANQRIINAIGLKLKAPKGFLYSNIRQYGNTSSSTASTS